MAEEAGGVQGGETASACNDSAAPPRRSLQFSRGRSSTVSGSSEATPPGPRRPSTSEASAGSSSLLALSMLRMGPTPAVHAPVTREGLLEAGQPLPDTTGAPVRQSQGAILRRYFMRFLCCSGIVYVLLLFVSTVIKVTIAVAFLRANKRQACDVPLLLWTKVTAVFWVLRCFQGMIDRVFCCWFPTPEESQDRRPTRIVLKNILFALLEFVWVIVLGLYFVLTDGTHGEAPCADVFVTLFFFAKVLIFFQLASATYILLNVIGLHAGARLLLRRGPSSTTSGAPKGAVEQNATLVKATDEDLQAHPACPICMQDFSEDDEPVLRTNACGHFFHEQCLRNWLKSARSCPICREDLGVFTKQVDKE